MTALPFYLAAGDDAVLCLFHEAAPAPDPPVGVLLCPPLGWDEVASYRVRRTWAAELAASGHPTLRVDLPSTGDSTGWPEDPGRLDAWTEALVAGAAWLRTRGGCRRVALVGLGVGGLLACRAVDRGAAADDLVLWGTPARGGSAVRELRALARLETAEFDVPAAEAAAEELPAGFLESGGFAFSAETVSALEALQVADLDLAGPGRRALLLRRDGLRVDGRLHSHLEAGGLAVQEAPGDGWGAMTPSEVPEAELPAEVVATIRTWLAAAPAGEGTAPAAPARVTPEITVDGGAVRELPFTLARPYGRMFGILAEPVEEPADLIAVLLNAGAVRRTGPNRLWVEVARRWAAQGVMTLRIDLEGIGDADGPDDRYSDVAEMYEPRMVDETLTAVLALAANRPDARFVLVGLCSGAHWAFHAARRLPQVATAIMLNPRQLFYDPAVDVRRQAQRAGRGAISPRRWRKLARGHVEPRLVARLARSSAVAVRRRRAYRQAVEGSMTQLESAFDELRDAGRPALIVFSQGEPLLDEMQAAGVLDDPGRWPNLQVEVIRGPGHTFRPVWSQRRVHDRIDRALAEAGAELEADAGGAQDEPLGATGTLGA